jgi:hypothetical protein
MKRLLSVFCTAIQSEHRGADLQKQPNPRIWRDWTSAFLTKRRKQEATARCLDVTRIDVSAGGRAGFESAV